MSTSLHRLQISLPEWQVQFLSERAQRDGVSIAEVVRQMIAREAAGQEKTTGDSDPFWDLIGAFRDERPLINGIPVSERPDLYLAAAALESLHPGDAGADENRQESSE